MLFKSNPLKKQFNTAIKEQNLKAALSTIIEGYESNISQDIKMFELIDTSDIFEVLNELAQEGKNIPDKYLALTSIYWNAKYFWDIGHGTSYTKENSPYPYLSKLYQEKINNPQYARVLFTEWKRLFSEMITEKTPYRSDTNTSAFYTWPHDYEENVIERTAFSLSNVMFKEAKKEEILEIMSSCQYYPKKPYGATEIDKMYNKQNSRYYDVQYLSSWLSENALPLTLNKKEISLNMEVPLVSQGLIKEIKLYYTEIEKDKSLLEPQDNMLFEKLFEQRLPELLKEYQSVDKNYHHLKNKDNLSADELLYNSLLEMRSIFEDFTKKINDKKIEDLSFNVKLTREFIKHNF